MTPLVDQTPPARARAGTARPTTEPAPWRVVRAPDDDAGDPRLGHEVLHASGDVLRLGFRRVGPAIPHVRPAQPATPVARGPEWMLSGLCFGQGDALGRMSELLHDDRLVADRRELREFL